MEPITTGRRVPHVHAAVPGDPGLSLARELAGAPRRSPDVEAVPLIEIDGVDDAAEADDIDVDVLSRSFEAFYAECRDRVGRALALTLGDAELAADAVDEAMARAYQHWSKVEAHDNPAGWVYRVGLNYARSHVRRRRGREELLHPSRHDEAPSIEPTVAAALAGLPARQRAVVVCRLLLGWSERETAAALNIRNGTVKSRLHRALRELQVELAHLDEEY